MIFFILLVFLSLLVYLPIFSSWFFMDDFYFLQISQANNIGEFVNFFKPMAQIPYRPISQQLFFFSFQKIFGLRPLPFFVFIFLIHILNSWIVYKISIWFIKEKKRRRLVSFCYLASPIFFVGLYSITGSYVLFGLFYFLLSFWYWIKFEKEKRNLFYFLSLLFFVLSIFSAEIGFSLPILIYLFSKIKDKIKRLIPYFLVIGTSLLINNFFAGAPKTETFSFQLRSFPSVIRWYLLRAFGLPEGVRNGYLCEKGIIYALFLLLVITLIRGIYKWYQSREELFRKGLGLIIKYLAWILLASLPFYFMSLHLNPIYFSVSFIGFLFLLEKFLKSKLFLLYSIIFIMLSFFSVQLLSHTHWTVRRAALAKEWLNKLKKDCFRFNQEGKIEIVSNDSSLLDELKITLQNNRALQLFCYNDKLETVYIFKNE